MDIGELGGIINVGQAKTIAGALGVRNQQHDPLLSALKLQLLEHDEVDYSEALPQPPSDRLGVVDRQKLSGKHHCQLSGWFKECGSMHERGRP